MLSTYNVKKDFVFFPINSDSFCFSVSLFFILLIKTVPISPTRLSANKLNKIFPEAPVLSPFLIKLALGIYVVDWN